MRQDRKDEPARPPPPGGRVLVFGEVLFDHYPDGHRALGGAPFNVAWHLCGFGLPPLLLSAVGDDPEGREILDRMEGWGLSTAGVGRSPHHPTGAARITPGEAGPGFRIPEDQAWDHIVLPDDEILALPEVGLLVHGTLALRHEASARAFAALRDKVDAPVLVDLNLRDPWWTRARAEEALRGADWAKLSIEELGRVTGQPPPAGADQAVAPARRLRERYGLRRLLVTCGRDGAILVDDADGVIREAAGGDPGAVDTVGAGDAFCAVAAMGIVHGWSDQILLRRATRFAGAICRIRGATVTDLSLYDGQLRHWAEPPWRPAQADGSNGRLYVLSLSVHGLVRAADMELGRDADTGGQVAYVVDQARALAEHPAVERVDLVTRRIVDKNVDDSYAEPEEVIAAGARIVRLLFGPRRYLRKESLWPYLDSLLDELTRYLRSQDRLPDVIHGHYADAGYVGAQLSKLLGIPFVFTGHSLGRVKKARLLEDGMAPETLESRYRIARRIEAEEQALEAADLVIASTRQEVASQYEGYDHYQPERMEVIPPGVDLTRFSPPPSSWSGASIEAEVVRFLRDPDKPMILALARPDERKNFLGLVEAYATTPGLRDEANLVLVVGNRDDIREMDPAPRRVLGDLLLAIDRHDLYGSVAYPKHHGSDDVPDLYRLAARSHGIFVNAALTEPFGLTLIEAAASGLPVVVTDDGGPRDILAACDHGLLADVMDTEALGKAILDALSDTERWGRWVKNAVANVHRSFSWHSHARRYLAAVDDVRSGRRPGVWVENGSRLPRLDRLLVVSLDEIITGDGCDLEELARALHDAGLGVGFAVASGRSLEDTLKVLDHRGLWTPDVLLTAAGTAIHYGSRLIRDRSWERQIRYRWEPEAVRAALAEQPGLRADGDAETPLRLRYRLETGAPTLTELRRHLRQQGLLAGLLVDHAQRLDVVPGRASPGLAVRFLAFKWNLPPERILVAGDSGNDIDMLTGETLGVVPAHHTPELDDLRQRPRVFFAPRPHAAGVLEGVAHYDFFGAIRTHDEEDS